MRKILVFFLMLLFIVTPMIGQRKKVGVVLSGGGAKGFAHIGALKVIEEAGIPIDYIAGTSMGAIVGGLYAIGYDARTLDSLVRIQDWTHLLSDNVYRYNLLKSERENTQTYIASINYKKQGIKLPAGVVSGQNILNLFLDLTTGYHKEMEFNKLPIPYSCVAADLKTGKEVVLTQGSLPIAMRASMAIPGFFSPIKLDSMVLIDGGVINNYPADVARQMGADIIIGIGFEDDEKQMEKNEGSLLQLSDNLKNFMGKELYDKNVKNTDLFIQVNLNPYTITSFQKEAVDSILLRGERTTRNKWDDLMTVKSKIGINDKFHPKKIINPYIHQDSIQIDQVSIENLSDENENYILRRINVGKKIARNDLQNTIAKLYGTDFFSAVYYRLENEKPPYHLVFEVEKKDYHNLNVGVRFDTEDLAAILLNTTIRLNTSLNSTFNITARLSKDPYLAVDYSLNNSLFYKGGINFRTSKNDINLYSHGNLAYYLGFYKHSLNLNFSEFYFYNMALHFGVNCDYFYFTNELSKAGLPLLNLPSKPYINYFLDGKFDNLNSTYFPTKGQYLDFSFRLFTDNFFQMEGGKAVPVANFSFIKPVSINDKVCITPSLTGRAIFDDNNVPVVYSNLVGGQWDNHYFTQQISLRGLKGMEIMKNTFLKSQIDIRYHFYKKHTAQLTANFSLNSDDPLKILDGDKIFGGSLGYSYNTIIGPLIFRLNYSNWTKKVHPFLTFGYYF